MELILRFLGVEFLLSLMPTQYEERSDAHLTADTAFGFAIDPLNEDKYWEDED